MTSDKVYYCFDKPGEKVIIRADKVSESMVYGPAVMCEEEGCVDYDPTFFEFLDKPHTVETREGAGILWVGWCSKAVRDLKSRFKDAGVLLFDEEAGI